MGNSNLGLVLAEVGGMCESDIAIVMRDCVDRICKLAYETADKINMRTPCAVCPLSRGNVLLCDDIYNYYKCVNNLS